jgi:hypothetical protein
VYGHHLTGAAAVLFGYDCSAAGHTDTVTVDAIGCLLLQPASLGRDTDYAFSRNYLFEVGHGLSVRRRLGPWNGRETGRGKSVELLP